MFECDEPELYKHVLNAFKNAKKADAESWDVAQLVIGKNSATYITCRGNKYILRRKKNGKVVVRFGYEGTRAGLIRLQPFPDLEWGATYESGGELLVKVGDEWRMFLLRLVKYKTATPKSWKVAWYEQIEKLTERPGYAVIMSGPFIPRRVVKYRDVYHQERG
jgi:hypothetical protein